MTTKTRIQTAIVIMAVFLLPSLIGLSVITSPEVGLIPKLFGGCVLAVWAFLCLGMLHCCLTESCISPCGEEREIMELSDDNDLILMHDALHDISGHDVPENLYNRILIQLYDR